MIAFLEKLTRRKTEVALKGATVWQQLVCDVADSKEQDEDGVLAELDRLGRTPDDLAAAVDLLNRRRAWAATVAAGAAAEKVRPGNAKKIEAELAAFAEHESEHEARLAPMRETERSAVAAIHEAASARSELARTASCQLALAAVRDADEKLAELRRERTEFEAALRTKEDRYGIVAAQKDSDLDGQAARLKSEVETMRGQLGTFTTRTESLTAEHEAARSQLMRPEAI